MNYSDSERIAGVLETAGYEKALLENDADLIVINACSVRQSAINRISGRFKKYKKLRKINPDLKIVLTGCVLESDRKKFEKSFDLVVGIGEMICMSTVIPTEAREVRASEVEESVNATYLLSQNNLKIHNLSAHRSLGFAPLRSASLGMTNTLPPLKKGVRGISSDYFQIKPLHQSKFSAYVPIMTGCNNFCSYCVVPYTRGREYSRPAEEILSEVENLVKRGYKEIILLGQNVNSYQSKFPTNLSSRTEQQRRERSKNAANTANFALRSLSRYRSFGMTEIINFPILLKLISNIPGDFWIRFLTSHPKDMSEELIKTAAECKKVTPYFHLALQSGDDEILKKMNRKYTAKHFLGLVKMIRKYLPDAAISTDVIVGFPGETEKQFQNTVEVMKKAKFDMAYINKYSPRAGTVAAKLTDDIDWQEKKRREKILTEVLEKTALGNNRKYIGKVVKVLADKVDNHFIYGKTESFKNVKILDSRFSIPDSNLTGKFVKIKITQAGTWGLEGEVAG